MSTAAITIPRNTPPSVAEKLTAQANKLANLREAAKEEGVIIGRTVVAGVTGLGLGFVKGRYEKTEISGVPIAGGVAIVAKLGGYLMGRRDQLATFAHAAGDSAASIAGYEFACEFGAEQRKKAGTKSSGLPFVVGAARRVA